MTTKLSSTSAAQALAQALRNGINAHQWRAGEVLRQEDLAAQFGVSRIPIREALAQLQSEGLVEIAHHRGARVKGFTPQEVDEIFDLRVLLETDLLAHALPLHTVASVRQLRRIQAPLDLEDDRLAWLDTDRAFHQALYAPAQRPRTQALVDQLRLPVERYSIQHLSPSERREDWSDEHHALIQAIEQRDDEAARSVLTNHLNATRLIVINSLLDIKE